MMQKNKFFLIKAPSKMFRYVTFSADISRPDEYLSDVERALRAAKYEGNVLFDLLLSNGTSGHRFYKAHFDGRVFQVETFTETRTQDLEDKVVNKCRDFYAEHTELLEHSVLTRAQRFLIQRKAI